MPSCRSTYAGNPWQSITEPTSVAVNCHRLQEPQFAQEAVRADNADSSQRNACTTNNSTRRQAATRLLSTTPATDVGNLWSIHISGLVAKETAFARILVSPEMLFGCGIHTTHSSIDGLLLACWHILTRELLLTWSMAPASS